MEEKLSKCPVCGHEGIYWLYDICPVCDWERDPHQEEMPDFDGLANVMSLNQARQAWKEGREVR